MGVAGIITIILIVLIGGYYIHTVSKLGRLHEMARNAAGELDTLLWDRNHVLDQIIKLAEEKGMEIPEEYKENLTLGLGMLPTLQMSVYSSINNRGNAVIAKLNEDSELAESDDMKRLCTRFTNLKMDIADSGSRYNQRATQFNAYIQSPLAHFLSARKNMREKGHFNIAMAEVTH